MSAPQSLREARAGTMEDGFEDVPPGSVSVTCPGVTLTTAGWATCLGLCQADKKLTGTVQLLGTSQVEELAGSEGVVGVP